MKKIYLILLILFSVVISFGQQRLNIHKFPLPEKTKERLFYLQRTLNLNTIIYDACFDSNGKLDTENPVKVYWIRYDEDGHKMPLRFFEKQFAFGVESEKLINHKYDYKIKIAAWNNRDVYIKQIAPFEAIAYLKINGVLSVLDHIFIGSDPHGSLSKVEYVDIYGYIKNATTLIKERIL